MAPNDEFIREVDEEYRRDKIAQIWQRYNGIIVGVIVLVVACVGGWRFWQHMQETRAQEAATRYEEALRLSSEDKGQEAQGALENVVKEDAGTGYAMLARFRLLTSQPGAAHIVVCRLDFRRALLRSMKSDQVDTHFKD